MNKVEVVEVPDDDSDYVVCVRLSRPMTFPDNIIDLCCKCGEAIQHRPHIPKGVKLVCIPCITPDMKRDIAKGELHVQITTETAKEVAGYFRKKRAN